MKRLILIIWLIMFSLAFSNSIEEAIKNYYDATVNEDINKYLDSLDLSNSSEVEINNTIRIALTIFEQYDVVDYNIEEMDTKIDGNYALATYRLYSKIKGAEELESNIEYIMLLHKINNQWKVVFVKPLDEYLEESNSMRKLIIVKDIVEEELNNKEDKEPEVLFDGEEMQDLDQELEEELYSCSTDNYCIENGLGEKCENGKCSGYETCAPAIAILLLGIGFLRINNNI